MSNLIPPLLSSTPPPITAPLDEEDDDEFGDFRAAESYDCDDFSPPPSPQKSPPKVNLDINSNNSQISMPTETTNEKDFQDRRKSAGHEFTEVNCSGSCGENPQISETEASCDGAAPAETDDFSEKSDSDEIKSDFKGDNGGDSESSLSLKACETDPKLSDDEFGDFENHFPAAEPPEDDFDDFVSPLPASEQRQDDGFGDFESSDLAKDEFGDFGDFSAHTDSGCERPAMMEIEEKDAFAKSETILKDIFPVIDGEVDDFQNFDETSRNFVFEELKDVTETNALIYQWSKSNSQKMFLKALNIDMRNILYGPAWNCMMPRFAANLGLAPLEPVKSEILTPTPVQNASSPSNSSQKSTSDIPTAQFDWSGSGLINPLDSATSTELPGSIPEGSPQPPTKPDFLPTASDKTESVPALFETASKDQQPDDFSPFQSPKMIPLRETHISNETINEIGAKPGWLEPTILTPDLPRKEPVMDPDDDEFDDFQMVLPEEAQACKSIALELGDFDAVLVNKPSQEHISKIPPSQPALFTSGPSDTVQNLDDDDDDEFTDFHSVQPPEILQPVPLEPLKPSLQYTPTQINWPDPGVTDEDIRNIELTYSRKTEPEKDDDEWSDFVSVTNPVKPIMPERTATPDLPLSVLNLNHVQAPKQPIPVITPTGLVQTKLSSNLSKSVVQTTLQPSMFRPPLAMMQPSTISSQFAASQNLDDDDDWSDFVSSQPVANGYQQKAPKAPMNWTSANIITNPTHFDSFPPQQQKRSAIPSISAIPDLDFIAPKNRTKK